MHCKPHFLFGVLLFLLTFSLTSATANAQAKPWKIYLLFGQSNMTGGQAPGPDDVFNNPRVKQLQYNTCSGRTYEQWYMDTGGLHCMAGFGIGDWFGKIVADSLSQDTLALIPCAIAGVDIDFFRKNIKSRRRGEFKIPPDDHWDGAYPWMIERLTLALQKGVMAGVLLHQGEADWQTDSAKVWPAKVAEIMKDLKQDLKFGDVPLMIGELRADSKACCGANNVYLAQEAKNIPNGHVVSSANLTVNNDAFHFDGPGLRELAKRYAAGYLQALATTALTRRDGAATGSPALSTTWRLGGIAGNRILEFNRYQDHIVIRDSRGRLLAEGSGLSLRLPDGSKRGLLFFQAKAGSAISRGTLFDMP